MAGRRSGSETRKRTRSLTVRFNEQEAAALRSMADRSGRSVGAVVRAAVLKIPPPPPSRRPSVDHKAVARLLGELGKIGSNLNQIAKHANAGREITDGTAASIELALRELTELRHACMRALGREPDRPH